MHVVAAHSHELASPGRSRSYDTSDETRPPPPPGSPFALGLAQLPAARELMNDYDCWGTELLPTAAPAPELFFAICFSVGGI